MDYIQNKSTLLCYHNSSTEILEPMIDEIEISQKYLIKVEYNRLGKNPQTIILYDIIQDRLPLNHLQRVVMEEALNHVIPNKGN